MLDMLAAREEPADTARAQSVDNFNISVPVVSTQARRRVCVRSVCAVGDRYVSRRRRAGAPGQSSAGQSTFKKL